VLFPVTLALFPVTLAKAGAIKSLDPRIKCGKDKEGGLLALYVSGMKKVLLKF